MTTSYKEFLRKPSNGKRQKFGLGGGLYGGIEPTNKGGGKFLFWKNSKYEKRLGSIPKIKEKKARRMVLQIQDWIAKGNHPKLFGKTSQEKNHTFKFACERYLETIEGEGSSVKPITFLNYKNQLLNQAVPRIGADTKLKDLEWQDETKGREILLKMTTSLRKGRTGEQARKVLGVCRQVFDYAIDQGWMSRGTNPALHPKKWKQVKSHHPTITWAEVPQLIEDLNENKVEGFFETVLVVKFMMMTFLRVSTVVRLQWDWIQEVDGIRCFVIPPDTQGLKRTKSSIDEGSAPPHLIPMTPEIDELLGQLRNKTGWQEYIFYSPRGKTYPHIHEDVPTKHLKRLGYAGKLTAHGWRSVVLTVGQDVLKFPFYTIQRQMGHLLGDKVREAYDRSKILEERKEFLDSWTCALFEKGLVT